jgi:hypothetical protein
MVNKFSNINEMNNLLSPQIIEHKKDENPTKNHRLNSGAPEG